MFGACPKHVRRCKVTHAWAVQVRVSWRLCAEDGSMHAPDAYGIAAHERGADDRHDAWPRVQPHPLRRRHRALFSPSTCLENHPHNVILLRPRSCSPGGIWIPFSSWPVLSSKAVAPRLFLRLYKRVIAQNLSSRVAFVLASNFRGCCVIQVNVDASRYRACFVSRGCLLYTSPSPRD